MKHTVSFVHGFIRLMALMRTRRDADICRLCCSCDNANERSFVRMRQQHIHTHIHIHMTVGFFFSMHWQCIQQWKMIFRHPSRGSYFTFCVHKRKSKCAKLKKLKVMIQRNRAPSTERWETKLCKEKIRNGRSWKGIAANANEEELTIRKALNSLDDNEEQKWTVKWNS